MTSRERVLELIARQLKYYELDEIAAKVAPNASKADGVDDASATSLTSSNALADYVRQCQSADDDAPLGGIPHLQKSSVGAASSRPADNPRLVAHKGPVTCAAFSPNGLYVATGSEDTSLKVLSVERMKRWTNDTPQVPETKPSVRALYDHVSTVTDVVFHPNGRALASSGLDCSIKLYDLQRFGIKRSFRQLQDSHPVNGISFHPSGDYLMAATDDSTPHLFDVATQKAFLPVHSAAPHTGAIACVRYAPGGSYYATCGRDDGTIKVWDGATGACVRTVDKAHGGGAVYSVQVLLGSQLLLSMGHDGKPRLWDISSGAQVMEFVGRSGECSTGTQAAMSWNEELVVSADERPCGLMVWCARTGKLLERVSTYNSLVRGIACSPVEDAVLSCGQDARARFWTASAE